MYLLVIKSILLRYARKLINVLISSIVSFLDRTMIPAETEIVFATANNKTVTFQLNNLLETGETLNEELFKDHFDADNFTVTFRKNTEYHTIRKDRNSWSLNNAEITRPLFGIVSYKDE